MALATSQATAKRDLATLSKRLGTHGRTELCLAATALGFPSPLLT